MNTPAKRSLAPWGNSGTRGTDTECWASRPTPGADDYRVAWSGLSYVVTACTLFGETRIGSEPFLQDAQKLAQRHADGAPDDGGGYRWSRTIGKWYRIGIAAPRPAPGKLVAIERAKFPGIAYAPRGWIISNAEGHVLAVLPANPGAQTHDEAGELARKIVDAFNGGQLS